MTEIKTEGFKEFYKTEHFRLCTVSKIIKEEDVIKSVTVDPSIKVAIEYKIGDSYYLVITFVSKDEIDEDAERMQDFINTEELKEEYDTVLNQAKIMMNHNSDFLEFQKELIIEQHSI